MYFRLYNLQAVCLRYFNVFGPRQNPDGNYAAVIPKFITSLLAKDGRPIIYGHGKQTRDFVSVKDVVKANILACNHKNSKSVESYNIGSGKTYSVNRLFDEICKISKVYKDPIFKKSLPGDARSSSANITKAQKLLGYAPETNIRKRLALTVEWFKNEYEGR